MVDAGHQSDRERVWPAPWPLAKGLAVFVASAVFGIASVAVEVFWLGWLEPSCEEAVFAASLLANLLLVYVLYRRVLAGSRERLFGPATPRLVARRCAEACLLVAVDVGGSLLLRILLDRDSISSIRFRELPSSLGLVLVSNLVLGPLVEELTFRWVLYRTLRTRLGVASSVVLTAAAFSFVHLGLDVRSALVIFWGGLVLAVGVERFRNLESIVAAHSVWNLLALLLEVDGS